MALKLGRLATPLIAFALVVLAANAWVSYRNTASLVEKEDLVQDAQAVLLELEGVLSDVTSAVAAERGYLLTGDAEHLLPYDESKARATERLTRVKGVVADPRRRERAERLSAVLADEFAILDKGVELRRQGPVTPAQLGNVLGQGKGTLQHIRSLVAELKAAENRLLVERDAASRGSFGKALFTLATATAVAMGMVALAYALMRRDESARRRADEQLRGTEARKAAVVDAVLDSIVGMDREGRVVEWNAAAEKTFGYAREQALGRDMAELIIPPSYREAHREGLKRYLATGEGPVLNRRIEVTAVRADGGEFPIELAITPINTGGPQMFTGYIRDITDRKRSEDALLQSEERSRLLLDSTGEGIYGVDMVGDCTFANRACAQMLGYDEPAELLGQPTHALFHHTRADGSPYPKDECRIYQAFLAGDGVQVDDEVFWRRDGSSFPVEYRSYPVVRDGEKLGAVVSFVDTTSRRRAEHGMRLRESALRAIAQGVFITDPGRSDEPITYVNAAFEELTGYPWREIKGRKIDFFAGPDTEPGALRGLEEALVEGREHTAELLLYRKDEAPFWGTVSLAPVTDSAGRVTHFVGVVTDVTARRRWEEELKRAKDEAEAVKEQAEAANVAKSQFLANMSHELRTPLNAVIMYSELLQEEAEDRSIDGFIPDLDKIRAAGKHLLALVNGVLDLSKIEAGKMDLYLETFDACQMVRDVAATVEPLVQKRSNKLELRCPPDAGPMHADLTKVRQVLFNLLSNAAKFTERGTIAVDVTRQEVGGAESVVLSVSDTGIGMTPEQLAKLFQPFTQADASTTRKYGGTGLGLAISKRFAEIMGGEIRAVSEPGKGSTFTLRLPSRVAKPAPPDAGKKDEQAAGPAGAPTVLIIDDEPSVHDLMARALSAEGLRVVAASDGEAGLRLARELRPCLIFLDVLMPKMDGWAVLTALKADAQLADIPVVMLTITSSKDMGYLLGASEYLNKPIDRERLGSLIKRYRPSGGGACEVLVVEDDEPTRQVIRRTLAKQGWTVAEAQNGRAALEKVRTEPPPGLILLDLMMPEMDGFEFLSELRQNEAWDAIPVVVLTAKDLTPQERAMLSGNVERILQKGAYTREALLQEVRKIVSQCTAKPQETPRPGADGSAPPARQQPEAPTEVGAAAPASPITDRDGRE